MLARYTDQGSRNCTALVLERGRKWMHVALVEADGYRKAKLPLTEERYMKPLELTRKTRAAINRIAKRTTNRKLRKQVLAALQEGAA